MQSKTLMVKRRRTAGESSRRSIRDNMTGIYFRKLEVEHHLKMIP
jgi:hypothetical protein